jgi:nitroimidazol reductase NimA-like FMN-containing flavoprotein (pyridoxamine 5'-phosphate oxidase superfamily)
MSRDKYGVEMTDTEIAEFLTRQGHGVLSFGGEVPYGLPVSFGYDVLENRCIFQLLFDPDSRKQSHIDESDAASLVAYEWVDIDDWRSVVIDGRLDRIDADEPAALDAAEVFADYGSVVGLTVFNRPLEELRAEWYQLDIVEMRGFQSPVGDEDRIDE